MTGDASARLVLALGAEPTTLGVAQALADLLLDAPGVLGVDVLLRGGPGVSLGRPGAHPGQAVDLPLRTGTCDAGRVVLRVAEPDEVTGDLHRVVAVGATLLSWATAREQQDREIDRLSRELCRDDLTGLANRSALGHRRSAGTGDGVLYLDVDEFKTVNDHHGHRVGDLLLIAVGERLATLVRCGDRVYRVGGDEFVVCCHDVGTTGLDELSARLSTALAAPFDLGGITVRVTVSIGAASGAGSLASLVDRADRLMYDAKRARGALR